MVSKSLSSFEGILPSKKFSRVHSKYLVNLNYVSQYVKGRAGMVVLTNGYEIDVSEGRKSDFLTRLKKLAHFLPDRKN
jgi:two-component system LytT family response regulator